MSKTFRAIIESTEKNRPLENVKLSKSQNVLITILDEQSQFNNDAPNDIDKKSFKKTTEQKVDGFSDEINGLISKEYFMRSIIISWIFIVILSIATVAANLKNSDGKLFLILLLIGFSLYLTLLFIKIWYKSWDSIQDGHARTTPKKAIGYSFIPIFNLYWMYQLTWGFAKDFNSYLERHNLSTNKLSEGLFITFATLSILNVFLSYLPIIGQIFLLIEIILSIVVVNYLCDAINSIRQLKKT